jgi:hypothetical protein
MPPILIYMFITISLTSGMMLAGISYINPSTINVGNYIQEIELSSSSLSSAIDGFSIAQGYQLPEENWKQNIASYGSVPKLSLDSQWHYNIENKDQYLCIVSPDNKDITKAFERVVDKYPTEFTLTNECQDTPESNTVALSTKI